MGDSTSGRLTLQLDVVLESRFLDEAELRLEPVDMLFLGQQDVAQQIAADEVAVALTAGNPVTQHWHSDVLEPEIALQDLLRLSACCISSRDSL